MKKLDPSTIAKIQPLMAELKTIDESDFLRLGGILRQIAYYCQAPEEMAGFDRLENHVRYLGLSLN